MATIVTKRILNPTVTLMEVSAPMVADYDAVRGTVTIMYQRVGLTTQKLDALESGEEILDVVGPLGNPTEVEGVQRAVIIGGGVGCAIAFPQAKALYRAGAHVDVIVGFRTKDLVFLEGSFRRNCTNLYITTDDGTYGEKGFVSNKLSALLEAGNQYDVAIAIGPIPMMRAISQVTLPYNLKTIVSLNPIMVDGTGMCGGCRVQVGGQTKFACVDGPDFDGHQVDYDELIVRNGVYREQEAFAKAAHAHTCRMQKMAEELAKGGLPNA